MAIQDADSPINEDAQQSETNSKSSPTRNSKKVKSVVPSPSQVVVRTAKKTCTVFFQDKGKAVGVCKMCRALHTDKTPEGIAAAAAAAATAAANTETASPTKIKKGQLKTKSSPTKSATSSSSNIGPCTTHEPKNKYIHIYKSLNVNTFVVRLLFIFSTYYYYYYYHYF